MNNRPLPPFLKFVISSLTSSLIDLGLFHLLCVFLADIRVLSETGIYLSIATYAARLVSATYNYLVNYYIVFGSQSSRIRSLSKYILLALAQVSVSAVLVTVLYGFIGGREVFVKIPVDLCLFVISYFVQKKFVYK
ncbi:MAG: GtrA family protein [Lachnospiraceae bacterium]|nr:GtrA family protein [Lachnospiraceae bacterium]